MLASLPGVLYETPAHPSGIENIFARRMVLASGFRGSSLRLPLSELVCCEIATRTLDTRLRRNKGGDGGRRRAVARSAPGSGILGEFQRCCRPTPETAGRVQGIRLSGLAIHPSESMPGNGRMCSYSV